MATELLQLIDAEIPEGRQSLQDSHANLEKVAQYCESNYLQAADKRKAFEETKNYANHSLASVAYQINNLATNFLKLLDLQQNQLADMESSVNHLNQIVMIHKEKVARREIGVLTTNKTTSRPPGVRNGIIFPEQQERPVKYLRKPIDYGTLDEIGHGVRSHGAAPRTSRASSVSSTGSGQAPTTRPPTPPQQGGRGVGTMRQSGHYRTPAPHVTPPAVPGHYGPGSYTMASGAPTRREGGYASTNTVMGQVHMPPVGMARPMSQNPGQAPGMPSPSVLNQMLGYNTNGMQALSQGHVDVDTLPPPPPELGKEPYPHPDIDDDQPAADRSRDTDTDPASPPLPPPPVQQQARIYNYNNYPQAPPPGMPRDEGPVIPKDDDPYAATGPDLTCAEPKWVPSTYLEKVVAIYDYQADKEDELTFQENSVIYVIKKNEDDWWEGMMDGVTGLFPGNYVEPCM
ncbi:abl interactor 2-like isoform X2 [Liolophura sinensis]|uniref:abl interactor 2-like isoform X2 n=1 Tax=Liolophura sinensis TaxID=3198878 RepID=UPI0031580413